MPRAVLPSMLRPAFGSTVSRCRRTPFKRPAPHRQRRQRRLLVPSGGCRETLQQNSRKYTSSVASGAAVLAIPRPVATSARPSVPFSRVLSTPFQQRPFEQRGWIPVRCRDGVPAHPMAARPHRSALVARAVHGRRERSRFHNRVERMARAGMKKHIQTQVEAEV